jgi:hypothetical protein
VVGFAYLPYTAPASVPCAAPMFAFAELPYTYGRPRRRDPPPWRPPAPRAAAPMSPFAHLPYTRAAPGSRAAQEP